MANLKTNNKAIRKKPMPGKANEIETLRLAINRVERRIKEGESLIDFSKGYVNFVIYLTANDKSMEIEKRIRLDKPDKMLKKFVSKIKFYAETHYKERKYFISQEAAPSQLLTHITNEDKVSEGMTSIFEEIDQFLKTKKAPTVKTTALEF